MLSPVFLSLEQSNEALLPFIATMSQLLFYTQINVLLLVVGKLIQ